MENILQSQIFFFISSLGFIVLWVLAVIFLFYLIRATKAFSRIIDKLEKDVDKIGDTTKDLLEEIKNSIVFNFLFKKKKKRKKD